MKVTVRRLRRIIRESLAQFDPPGSPKREHPAMADTAYRDHPEYRAGSKDASMGINPVEDPSPEYQAGYRAAMQEW